MCGEHTSPHKAIHGCQETWKASRDNLIEFTKCLRFSPPHTPLFSLHLNDIVPEHICKLVFNFYDDQCITVRTNEWTTDWMPVPCWCIPRMPVVMYTHSGCLQPLLRPSGRIFKDIGCHVNSNIAY